MPGGRPRWKPTPEQLEKVTQLAGAQCSISEICSTLGIGKDTLYRNEKLDEEFSDLIKGAKEKGKAFAKNALFKLMAGGNVSAIIFYLKTQCGWKEKVDITARVEHYVAQVPIPLEVDEWQKLAQSQELPGNPKTEKTEDQAPKLYSSPAQQTKSSLEEPEAEENQTA